MATSHRGKPKDPISRFFSNRERPKMTHIHGSSVYTIYACRRDNSEIVRDFRVCMDWDSFYRIEGSLHRLLEKAGENPYEWRVFDVIGDRFK